MKPGEQSPRPQAHVLSALCPNLAVLRPARRCLQGELVTHICVHVAGLQRGAVSKCAPTFGQPLSPAASQTWKPTPPLEGFHTASSVHALEWGSATTAPQCTGVEGTGPRGWDGEAPGTGAGHTLSWGPEWAAPAGTTPAWPDGQTQEEEAANQERAGGAGREQVGVLAAELGQGMPGVLGTHARCRRLGEANACISACWSRRWVGAGCAPWNRLRPGSGG